jgi:hypothetical protein
MRRVNAFYRDIRVVACFEGIEEDGDIVSYLGLGGG